MKLEIVIGNVHSSVSHNSEIISLLRGILRVENDYMARKKSNFKIPQYNYLISDKGLFLTGHVDIVTSFLKGKGLKFVVHDARTIQDSPNSEDVLARLSHLKYLNPPIKLRDYQSDALINGIERQMGIFHVATGGGKTLLMSSLILAWHKKTLILVDSKDLARQIVREVSFFTGLEVGLIGDGDFNPAQVTVGMVQTLAGKKGSKKDALSNFFDSIEYVVCDEAHHAQSPSWRKVIKSCKNASIRHGFTATPLTSKVKNEEGGISNLDMLLSGHLGPIVYRMTTADLIEKGYLSKPQMYFVKNSLYFDGEPLAYAEEYDRIISKDEDRNSIICQIFKAAYDNGERSIGFLSRVEHGEIIAEMLVEKYGIPEHEISFAHGNVFYTTRKEMIENFKDGTIKILFGTVLNEGLDFLCEVGINIAGGLSDKLAIQRAGRVLRKPREESGDVDRATIREVKFFDLEDVGHPFFSKHARARKKIYKNEGHDVKVIKPEDIDGELFK